MLSEFESKIFGWMSDYIKNYRLSKTLDKNLEKTNALAAATKAMAALSNETVQLAKNKGFENDDLNLLIKVLSFQDELEGLIDNNLGSFEALSEELKQDKKFILLAVMSGVDGRILNHVNPYLIFTDRPESEQEFENWYENAIFDDEFFRLLSGLNEHSFYGVWCNPKIEEFVGNGYAKFDIWENQSAWISAFKNPRFLRYHDDFSFNLLLDEWDDTPVKVELRKLITNVKKDIYDFAKSILNDYFRLRSREAIEVQYDICFEKAYLNSILSDRNGKKQSKFELNDEIYDCTDLRTFERILEFILEN
jgi:hypothetical protein